MRGPGMPTLSECSWMSAPFTVMRSEFSEISLDRLVSEYQPRQYSAFVYGKMRNRPRLEAWVCDDPIAVYTYGQNDYQPSPFTPYLEGFRARISDLAGCEFNSCLINEYQHGGHYVSPHADDEPTMGPVVWSISAGATRRFRFTPKKGMDGETATLELRHGDALGMLDGCQDLLNHALLPTKKDVFEGSAEEWR